MGKNGKNNCRQRGFLIDANHGKVKQLPPDVQISSIEARLKELQEKLDKNLNEFPPSLHEIRLAERRRRYREKKKKNKIPSS